MLNRINLITRTSYHSSYSLGFRSSYNISRVNPFSSCSTIMSEKPATITPPAAAEGEVKKPKTAKELEKERKKAEKLAKFQAKQAKKQQQEQNSKAKEPKKPKVKAEKEVIPEWVDPTVPGEKKVLVSFDDPAFKSYNPKNTESSWYQWWVKKGFFEPKLDADGNTSPKGSFVIPSPPPNVTGALHIGHALTVAIQDSLVRYNRMKGKTVLYVPGFDHAGISTQSVVEKNLWATEKVTRQDLGREKFLEKVWEWKEVYHQKIKSQFSSLGASYDWSREAFTLSPELSKAVIEAFVRLHKSGYIYRENKLVNWCVQLRSATSNSEIESVEYEGRTLIKVPGYDEKVEVGVITSFSYPIEGTDDAIVVATTRPETIFGDTAVAVHPNDERYKHLHGKYVLHPFLDRRLPIITDAETVEMEFGTGAVKITPAHDENDYNTGKRNNLEFINIYTEDGKLNDNCGEWAGMKRFDARKKVIESLKEKGLFVEQKDNKMVIPKCTRTGDMIEPYLKPQWWVRQSELGKLGLKVLEDGQLKISPKSSEAEYLNWTKSLRDWCVSRQLWWGHRVPAWFVNIEGEFHESGDGEYWIVARDVEEAKEIASKKFAGKNFTLEQDEDVLDTWFSSGLWPFATLGWPNKTSDFEKFYPTTLLETGWDIIFNWVIRMVLLGTELTGKSPFSEVYCHPLVRDAQGRKMSKSLGNVVDPLDVITGISLEGLHSKLAKGNLDPREIEKAKAGQKESYPMGIAQCGADALRFALCAYTTGGRDINLNILRVEGYRKFCNKMYQATKFALMRLGDDFVPNASEKPTGQESLVEKWILNKMNTAAETINNSFEGREFMVATNTVYNYWLNELCDVYIENSKYLILEGTPEQQKSAKNTLYTCIEAALKMIHPFMPYVTEELWQRLPKRPNDTTESIVIAAYPEFQEYFKFPTADSQYELILDITKSIRSLLAQYDIIKNGQVYIEALTTEDYEIAQSQQDLIVSLIKGVNKVEVLKSGDAIPSGCGAGAVNSNINVHVLVKGQIDIDEQITKISKKLEKAKKSKENTEKLINAKDFAAKASQDVQAATLERFENIKADIDILENTISSLEKLKL
ncbi:valine--tRNA ligase [Saccharomycopsis crataegensis]|uniref:Valine--tRNA ligase, mitochondrial n=1 Tax=Saccharomycopsis crataegensis TaxID=43959 RepID=A0AAV5QGC9_9ASCO|nr:valine--tRNA ligase [Saccharomycopsis crataegensis]